MRGRGSPGNASGPGGGWSSQPRPRWISPKVYPCWYAADGTCSSASRTRFRGLLPPAPALNNRLDPRRLQTPPAASTRARRVSSPMAHRSRCSTDARARSLPRRGRPGARPLQTRRSMRALRIAGSSVMARSVRRRRHDTGRGIGGGNAPDSPAPRSGPAHDNLETLPEDGTCSAAATRQVDSCYQVAVTALPRRGVS